MPLIPVALLSSSGAPTAKESADSDRGSQYCGAKYLAVLDAHGVIRSMSRKGNCWDNAPSESFFGTLKQELILRSPFLCCDGTRTLVFEYLEVYYNPKRRHGNNNRLSPAEFERQYFSTLASV